jgi:P2 family phage contractile tail tube protein
MAIPQELVNIGFFTNGVSYVGQCTSLTQPKLTIKTDDYRAAGMDAPVKMDVGMEPLVAGFSIKGVAKDVLALFGLADQTAFNAVFRKAFKDQTGTVQAVAVTIRGQLAEIDPGDDKPGEGGEQKFSANCSYYQLTVDGAVVHEIDVDNCIRTINGVDQLAAVRAAIGM